MFWHSKNIDKMKEACKIIDKLVKDVTLCFTGHRAQKLPWKFNEKDERCLATRKKVKDEIEKAIIYGYLYFISGMALGFDMMCAELVLELKKKYPKIKLIAALPCKDQDKLWHDDQKKRYANLLKKCDEVRCLYDTHVEGCELERNDYMLNNSSMVIALFNGLPGGTKSTILKAQKMGLKTIIIKPLDGYGLTKENVSELFDLYQKPKK